MQSKTIKGKVEELESGNGFGDAKILASEIKIQHDKAKTKDINISNNDGGAIVIPDTRTNSVLIAGLQEDIALAEEAIKYLDKPLTQVAIEVSLIELSKEDKNNLGLNFAGQSNRFSLGYNNTFGNAAGNIASLTSGADTSGIAFSTVNKLAEEAAFKINALIQNNKTKVLANPTIVTLDGSEALIKITDQIVSKMTVTTEPNTGTVTYTPELSDIGIVLNLLPKVGDNGYVTLKVRPSITTLLEEKEFGKKADGTYSGFASLISTREVILQDTRIKAGETLAIAGLIKESEIVRMSKLPFAGDLPVFGKFFRNKTSTRPKTELVILITPKIISDVVYN